MELNNTKVENPEVLIQALITRLETLELELKIAKYRLEQIQFVLTAEVRVEQPKQEEVQPELTPEETATVELTEDTSNE